MTAREHAPRPGVTWDTVLTTTGEVLDPCDQDDGNPFAWVEPEPAPANRATRRAAARNHRRNR